MDNQTSTDDFHILAFSINTEMQPLISTVFLLIYMFGVIGNLTIITVEYIDTHLHIPMYIFLGNLSFLDICLTTVTLPKLMDILLTGINSVSFIQCFAQMFCFILMGCTEVIILSTMAYDRYVAICQPLKYNLIMNKEKFVLLLMCIWISGCMNASFITGIGSHLSFCHSKNIKQFYCDIKALVNIACPDMMLQVVLLVESFLLGLFTFLLSLSSYIKIISSILHVKSRDSKQKAFSTCTSHLTVLLMFYGTIMCLYLSSPSEHSADLDQVFSVLYAAVTPMLNPLIYSLRNREVKSALIRILTAKSS